MTGSESVSQSRLSRSAAWTAKALSYVLEIAVLASPLAPLWGLISKYLGPNGLAIKAAEKNVDIATLEGHVKYPKWKERQCRVAIEQIGSKVLERYHVEDKEALATNVDLPAGHDELNQILDLLYSPDMGHVAWNERQRQLVVLLGKVEARLDEYSEEQQALALTIGAVVFTEVNFFEHAEKTFEAVDASPTSSKDVSSQLQEMMDKVNGVARKHRFGSFFKNKRKLGAKLGKFGFAPLLQHNIPEFFWETDLKIDPQHLGRVFGKGSRGSDDERLKAHTVRQIRTPTPTADPIGRGKPMVLGAFRLFIRGLQQDNKTLVYSNLQKTSRDEGPRVKALKAFRKQFPETFFLLSFPMDGKFFKRKGQPALSVEDLAQECRTAILGNGFDEMTTEEIDTKEGYYFPVREIKARCKKNYGFDLDFAKLIDHCLEQTKAEFYEEGEVLAPAKQQAFQMILNNRIEKTIVALLRADFVSNTCKDAQDRAGSKAVSKLYDTLVELGMQANEKSKKQAALLFARPAFYNKSQDVIGRHRGDVAVAATKRLGKNRSSDRFSTDGFVETGLRFDPNPSPSVVEMRV